MASIDRIFETLDTLPDVKEKEDALILDGMRGEVEFRNVFFGYEPDQLVLKNVSFVAKPGAVTALVGPSGGGKTTLVNLIPRFFDSISGSILVDGVDIRDLKINSLRQQIGIVLQDTHLFSGTIKENIRYGRPEATDEEAIEAAKAANAHDFIMQEKYGYDTEIGERGARLSGGQKQRIGIARAILRNPKILVLDEATSMLDSEAEAEIRAAISRLMKGRTTFVIAHRLSTVMNADQILVIDDGEVVERGTHQELAQAGGRYSRLCAIQFQAAKDLPNFLFTDDDGKGKKKKRE
jgi:subfamily B ATP-binding cassette protein MsbA